MGTLLVRNGPLPPPRLPGERPTEEGPTCFLRSQQSLQKPAVESAQARAQLGVSPENRASSGRSSSSSPVLEEEPK